MNITDMYGYPVSIRMKIDRLLLYGKFPYLKRKSLWISSQERILSDHITKSW